LKVLGGVNTLRFKEEKKKERKITAAEEKRGIVSKREKNLTLRPCGCKISKGGKGWQPEIWGPQTGGNPFLCWGGERPGSGRGEGTMVE